MKKSCELCKSPAKIFCDSDQASLCWTCDNKVHSANFLVARHPRILLCRVCFAPTPWTASGQKLGPSAVSFCQNCVVDGTPICRTVQQLQHDDDDDEYDGDEESENGLDEDDDEEEEDDNQVVPLSYTPPPAASSSSCGDYCVDNSFLLKRKRENVPDLCSEDDCLSGKKSHCVVESSEAIEGNRGTLYHFLPLSSEAMGEKVKMISTENNKNTNRCGPIVGLDLNESDC